MVKIRLARHGTKKKPFYQIVATDSRFPRNGRFLEKIGFFNPIVSKHTKYLEINHAKIDYWVKKGAIISSRILFLIKKNKKTNNTNELNKK
ncbi:30S ribosomal protein S16 [Buchnera aphidicola (Nipponaphis monzeni)]|uniref:Small ribosomal subunit protein bS16 n=1 Tax=Buchnera aphidicola (Nipponaphis monzeni) TaxID=2495405 RepID=A0A455TAG7_9GAMM|nr:30S ribosomal protein S16 [Buchnera aphidicola]BBI01312.1 30S ribosomal protein S16 [Buchnera aphidicola (Nipponaphis monzeni)]